MAIEVTAATLVDVIEIGFLFYAAYRDDTPPFSLSHTHSNTEMVPTRSDNYKRGF